MDFESALNTSELTHEFSVMELYNNFSLLISERRYVHPLIEI